MCYSVIAFLNNPVTVKGTNGSVAPAPLRDRWFEFTRKQLQIT